jgi:hypothetical protein
MDSKFQTYTNTKEQKTKYVNVPMLLHLQSTLYDIMYMTVNLYDENVFHTQLYSIIFSCHKGTANKILKWPG